MKAISLFCGAGGCTLGFKRAGYDVVCGYDFDEAAIETYAKNFGETRAILADLSKISFEAEARRHQLDDKPLFAVIGGPPCQGFSTAGARFWDDPRNVLLKNYVAALSKFSPEWFMFENVEGLLTAKRGEYIKEAIAAFIDLGYTVRLEKVYSQEYGIPQRRKRVIVVGNRLGIPFTFPRSLGKATGRIFRNGKNTLRSAIEDLEKLSHATHDHQAQFLSGVALRRVLALLPGQTMKHLPPKLQHESWRRRANRRVADGTPTERRGGAPAGIQRLNYDEPCLTITSASIREFIHPVLDRMLTMRECARIQTFPDDFFFEGSAQEKIKQIGNAIPPCLAEIFARHIRAIALEASAKTSSIMRPGLLAAVLTKCDGMSPALRKTEEMLRPFLIEHSRQLTFLDGVA